LFFLYKKEQPDLLIKIDTRTGHSIFSEFIDTKNHKGRNGDALVLKIYDELNKLGIGNAIECSAYIINISYYGFESKLKRATKHRNINKTKRERLITDKYLSSYKIPNQYKCAIETIDEERKGNRFVDVPKIHKKPKKRK
jgi:hypothetical protein